MTRALLALAVLALSACATAEGGSIAFAGLVYCRGDGDTTLARPMLERGER